VVDIDCWAGGSYRLLGMGRWQASKEQAEKMNNFDYLKKLVSSLTMKEFNRIFFLAGELGLPQD